MAQTILGLDSMVFIYLLEENVEYLGKVQSILRSVQGGEYRGILSVIGMIEIMSGPKRKGRFDLAGRYKDVLQNFPHLSIVGISEQVVDISSTLIAQHHLDAPDAIHLATAIDAGAERFITNDKSLTKVKEIQVKIL